jgi:hypothetical protein
MVCPPGFGAGGVVYWITSSARCSNVCGIVSPSAFAVLRLITNELGGLLDQEVGWLGAFEDLVNINGGGSVSQRLATRPSLTASPLAAMTIGVVLVAR